MAGSSSRRNTALQDQLTFLSPPGKKEDLQVHKELEV